LIYSPSMKINFLTKSQRKSLLKRIAEVLALDLKVIKETQKLTFKEMCAITGIQQNRLSELVQKKQLNEKTLYGIIGGNVVKVSELLKKVGPLTAQEKTYMENFYLQENRELRELLLKCLENKIDPMKLLKAALII